MSDPAPAAPAMSSPFVAAVTPQGSQPAAQDWGAAVGNFLGGQQAKATGNLMAAQDVDPDKASVAQVLAPVLGVPASAMEKDPSFWQSQFKLQAARATMGTDANLQKWLADDPANAKVSSDDIHQLGIVGTLAHNFTQGFGDAALQQRVGELGFSEQTGAITPQQSDLLQTFKEQLAAQGADQKDFAARAGRFLGGTAQMFAGALPEAAAGAAAGAGAGALAGGVGAVPGAIGGAVTGLTLGIAGQQGIAASGQVYDQLNSMTDKSGKPIPEVTKQAAAVFAGGITAALANVGGDALSAPVKALVPGLVQRRGGGGGNAPDAEPGSWQPSCRTRQGGRNRGHGKWWHDGGAAACPAGGAGDHLARFQNRIQ